MPKARKPRARPLAGDRKTEKLTTRYSAKQLERVSLAADILGRQREEAVDESTFSREATLAAADRLIAEGAAS